jgi:hypothetical protein
MILNWIIVKEVMKMLTALNWLRIISRAGLWCSIFEHLRFLSQPSSKMAYLIFQGVISGQFSK